MLSSFFMQSGIKHTIILMLIACLLPWLCSLTAKVLGGFRFTKDNKNPRQFLANTTGIAARLNHAQINGYESLPIFLAGVLTALYCFVPISSINTLAAGYVGFRICYIVCYATDQAILRSLCWLLATAYALGLFVFALLFGF